MSAAQELILAMYSGFAALLLLCGYIYKLSRDRKRRSKQLGLPFTSERRQGERRARSDKKEDKKLVSVGP